MVNLVLKRVFMKGTRLHHFNKKKNHTASTKTCQIGNKIDSQYGTHHYV